MKKQISELKGLYNSFTFAAGVKISLNKIIDSINTYEDLEKYYVFFITTFSTHSIPPSSVNQLIVKLNNIMTTFKPIEVATPKIDLAELTNEASKLIDNKFNITSLKRYDIIKVQSTTEPIAHFHVVIKKYQGLVYTLCITTKTDFGRIPILKSRIFKGSNFVPSFFIFKESNVANKFYAIYDSKSEIKQVIGYINQINLTF